MNIWDIFRDWESGKHLFGAQFCKCGCFVTQSVRNPVFIDTSHLVLTGHKKTLGRSIAMRMIWTILGFAALAIGAIGVILPILPTTPFVILAAFFFAKGSPALQAWLEAHHVFGPMIEDWRQRGAIARKYKILALSMMAAALGASIFFGLATHILVIQGVCIALAGAFILSRPDV